MQKRTVDKVVCYVVRDGRLLVFRHIGVSPLEVGLQVPAGTVEPTESPEDGALREAIEETDLPDLRLVRALGVATYDITPYRAEVQRRHFFQLDCPFPTPDRWVSAERTVGRTIALECFWIDLRHAHVLQSGQGALISRLLD